MLFLAMLVGTALAGEPDVTLNGVDIRMLRDKRFEQVDVYIDKQGRVHISSDRYQVQVQDGADAGGMMPPPRDVGTNVTAPAESATPVRPSRLPPKPTDSASGTDVTTGAAVVRPSRIEPVASASDGGTPSASGTPAGGPVAAGSWWLATEDNASRGHEVRVYLNGTLVKTISSGDAQVIMDVSKYLKTGANDVMIMSRSLNPGGGGFYVYVGQGSNQGGSVTLQQPDIQHGLGASRKGDEVRRYTLVVAP